MGALPLTAETPGCVMLMQMGIHVSLSSVARLALMDSRLRGNDKRIGFQARRF
jgi:hypothetical protein